MNQIFRFIYKYSFISIVSILPVVIDANAAVVSRPTAANRSAAARVQNRAATITQTPAANSNDLNPEAEIEEIPEEPIIVDNKSTTFANAMAEISSPSLLNSDLGSSNAIQEYMAAYDNSNGGSPDDPPRSFGAKSCNESLRTCMQEKCGDDFSDCAMDNTTIWGTKIEACRAKTNCTATEFAELAPEILADRDANLRLSYYESVIDCGDDYTECVSEACEDTETNCLSKADEDKAISACANIAKECREQDSGLAARFMDVFSELRTLKVAQVKKDEQRLYALRNLMRHTCEDLGAMFDERTLDCVYTVNFWSSDFENPIASKKLYAGNKFQCTPDWFGVDVTTYKENAYRITREQQSATGAAMGAGFGTAAGLLASGASINGWKAAKEKKEAQNDCKDAGGVWKGGKCDFGGGNDGDNNGIKTPGSQNTTKGQRECSDGKQPNWLGICRKPKPERDADKQKRKAKRATNRSECKDKGGRQIFGLCITNPFKKDES